MGAITNSTGYYVTGNDDGEKHEKRHGYEDEKEQLWKSYDDENVENVIEVSATQKSDDTKKLAFEKAYEQGMKTEEEWAEANRKRSKKRQDSDYSEYVTKTADGVQRGLTKLTKSKDARKRQLGHMQKAAIEYNGGLAINGTLYYLSNVSDYEKVLADKGEDGLKQYREFERDTLKTFHDSDLYKMFHGETEVRAEIHTGENGAQHLQTSEVLGETNGRGAYRMSPVAIREKALLNYYEQREGSSEAGRMAYERDIALEVFSAKQTEKSREKSGRFLVAPDSVKETISNKYGEAVEAQRKSLFEAKNFDKNPQKGDYVRRLFRRVENSELERIALEKAKEHDVSWKREWGVSDGVNRTKEQYINDMKLSEKESDVQKRNDFLDVRERTLSERESTVDDREKSVAERESSVSERENKLSEKEKAVENENYALIYRSKKLDKREKALNDRESDLEEKADELDFQQEKLLNHEFAVSNRKKEIDEKEELLKKEKTELRKKSRRIDIVKNRMSDIVTKSKMPQNLKRALLGYMNGSEKDDLVDIASSSVRPTTQQIVEIQDDLEF